jgi:hypothetical protein
VVDRWEVVGIPGLTSAGFYGEKGSGSHEHAASFVANPINAAVVVDDPYRQNNPHCATMVILTNAPVDKPLTAYNHYDLRSYMENSLFREAKQAWFSGHPLRPRRDKTARRAGGHHPNRYPVQVRSDSGIAIPLFSKNWSRIRRHSTVQ